MTLIRPGPAVPYSEVGAYRDAGTSLPEVGGIVTITRADTEEREELLAYLTRVDPAADTLIRVTEAPGVTSTSPDDFIAVRVVEAEDVFRLLVATETSSDAGAEEIVATLANSSHGDEQNSIRADSGGRDRGTTPLPLFAA